MKYHQSKTYDPRLSWVSAALANNCILETDVTSNGSDLLFRADI